MAVSGTVEKTLAPRISHDGVQLSRLDLVLDVGVFVLAVHVAAVSHLLILKFEEVTVDDLFTAFIENFEQSSLVVRVHILVELAERQEVLTIDALVEGARKREGADIESLLRSSNTATESRLVVIDGG